MVDPNPTIRRMAEWFVSTGTPTGIDCWNETYAEIILLRAERDAARATAQRFARAAEESNARLEDARKTASNDDRRSK